MLRLPGAGSHLLILQDDGIPAPGFAQMTVRRIAGAPFPTLPSVCSWVRFPASTAARVRRAKHDVRYVPLASSFMPLVVSSGQQMLPAGSLTGRARRRG